VSLFRTFLLWSSENNWLKHNLPRYGFIKKAVKKFMPGESAEEALNAAKVLRDFNVPVVFTKLGENITSLLEAHQTTEHYLDLLSSIDSKNIDGEISVKLTQIGFDLSVEETYKNISAIVSKSADLGKLVWIDMEGSAYTQATIDFYNRLRKEHNNVALCIQAYLYRTEKDLIGLLANGANIRLVKGAYKEPESIAFKQKNSVNENYFKLALILLNKMKSSDIKAAFATHDLLLADKILAETERMNIPKSKFEIQMLFGIRTYDQKLFAAQNKPVRVLISYGKSWYAWYLRRLAERPANTWFVIKNIFK
jgi:proline dehydrogenase